MQNSIDSRWVTTIPLMIPSLKRYNTNKKNPKLILEVCLDDLFKHYDAKNVYVLAQEYTAEEMALLNSKYPTVNFDFYPKRFGIIGTFNKLKEWGTSLGDCYVHYDDDVKMTHMFDDNPTLLAMENTFNIMPTRIGVVTTPSISIHHFAKEAKRFIGLHSNPAQLCLINSKAAKNCEYDKLFENFRSDTDFTMQIANQGYYPIIVNRFFSFFHSIPLAKIDKSDGKRKFVTLDNVKETKGSIGGDRRMEMRIKEFDAFQQKWPKVTTHANYRQQLLRKSIVALSNFKDYELDEIEKKFDYSLIKNTYEGYYGENPMKLLTFK